MASSATPPATGDGSPPQDPSALALPPSITSIRLILDEKVDPMKLVNIIGLVKDFSPPIKTRGTDFKAKMWLYDASLQEGEDSFEVSIFRREKAQIPVVGPGDVVCLQSAKVQRYGSGPLSCLSTHSTRIHVFKASLIPKPPADATRALGKGPGHSSTRPDQKIFRFVSALYHSIDKARVPDDEAFKVAADQALHVRDKFRELKNIKDGTFSDLVVRVVKHPFDAGDYVTVWVTDFTENDAFYQFLENGASDELYADPMGFAQTDDRGWEGPLGKMSLQITCWEPHASAIRDKVTTGTYVRLRNVQIKFGRNGANLEGFLRSDQLYPGKVNVDVLNPREEADDMDLRLMGLLRRKRDYARAKKRSEEAAPKEGESKKRKGEVEAPSNGKSGRTKENPEEAVANEEEPTKRKSEDEAPNNGKSGRAKKKPKKAVSEEEESKKRKGEGEVPLNSKERRLMKRAHLQAQEKPSQEDRTKLNPLVCSEDMGTASVPVSSIREKVYYNITTKAGPVRVELPFSNVKYRVVVRVVDFSPNTLEEFTFARNPEYGCLSDDDGNTSDDEADPADESTTWEWRFKLLLEDASTQAGPKPGRVWVSVDNPTAQCLTGLNASDLGHDTQGMVNLHIQMAKLWGNLEERKGKLAEREASKSKGKEDFPAQDSDEEASQGEPLEELSNEAFSCCLGQYGTKTAENDPDEANAGDGKRWERRYALFGTKIQYQDPDESQ